MYDIKPVTSIKSTVCGPVCLKMMLDWYGHEADLDALISECAVGVEGCSAAELLRVGRAHGLTEMKAYRATADSVLCQDRPAILHWRYNHFVVYAGLNDKGEPVICNPSRGRHPIDAGTFAALYSGIMLVEGTPADLTPEDYFGEEEHEDDYWHN